MNQRRLVTLLVLALVILGAGFLLASHRNVGQETAAGAAFLPALPQQMGSVSEITLRKASDAPNVTLHKQGAQWTVAQRADYPADFSHIRKLLLSLSDAKIVEKKTSDPANFGLIGLEDPKAPDASGTEIGYTDASGKHSVIIGKPLGNGNFARRTGENQSYAIEPGVYADPDPRLWLDTKVFDLNVADIQRIEIHPAGAAMYALRRVPAPAPKPADPAASAATPPPPPAADSWVLEGVPAGRKAADSMALAPSATVYGNFTADDVKPLAEVDFAKPTTAQVTLKDGSVLTFTGVTLGDKHYLQVAGLKDAALAARASGRAYEAPGYRYDGLFRPLEQLLVPLPPKPAKDAKQAAPAKGPKPPPAP